MIKIIQVWILNPRHLIGLRNPRLWAWSEIEGFAASKWFGILESGNVDMMGLATSKMIGEVISAPVEKIFVE